MLCVGPADAGWSGELEFGYLASSGNTQTESLNGKFGLDYAGDQWKNALIASGVYTTDEGETSAERYAAADTLSCDVTARDYLFAAVDWEKDLFGGVRERLSESAGYGRHVLMGPTHKLDVEFGAGVRQTQANDTGERQNDTIVRGKAAYQLALSETSRFRQSLKAESGESNTYVEFLSELKLAIVGQLYAVLSYTVHHNSDVPPGNEKTDTFTAVNLSYSFGK
ncbi:DUF481 domain-containing protein [Sinimarinibacterium sp. CAU 1509]|nr:DUF481 domain-containing protein [Sinimarinibacterium sp. CAU 1509]